MEKTHLLLIPGLLCTPDLWAQQIAALDDIADCHVPDHTRHDTMAGIARSVLETAPEKFALAGLSMGGHIAFEIMRQAPQRVTHLALLDTSALADTREGKAARQYLIDSARDDFEKFLETTWLPYMLPPAKRSQADLIAQILSMARDVGLQAYCRQQSAIINRIDSRPVCETIDCPVSLIVGELDGPTPPVRHEEIHSLIPGSTLDVISDCGHLTTFEAPEQVSALLRDWLTR